VTTPPNLTLLSDLWSDVRGSEEAAELEAELAREVAPGHALVGAQLTAVAARKFRKEIIFSLSDGRWAWVHLTRQTESDPRWPSVVIAGNWLQLVEEIRDGHRG
jgi:hypothetical protein